MKIGLSFSRCVRDIIEKKVDIEEVLIIIARTDFDPSVDEQWKNIWIGYTTGSGRAAPEWIDYDQYNAEHEELFRTISIDLYNNGKIHQPRKFGAGVRRLPYHWLEVGLPMEEMESRPAVKKAWENFQIIAGLSSNRNLFKDNF